MIVPHTTYKKTSLHAQQPQQAIHTSKQNIQEETTCYVCGKPATRMVCSIGEKNQVTAFLMCEECSRLQIKSAQMGGVKSSSV